MPKAAQEPSHCRQAALYGAQTHSCAPLQYYDVHVWFVAHPRQMRDWKGEPPTMYDISGSAHFINKADNGVVVHRNRNPDKGPMNEVGQLQR